MNWAGDLHIVGCGIPKAKEIEVNCIPELRRQYDKGRLAKIKDKTGRVIGRKFFGDHKKGKEIVESTIGEVTINSVLDGRCSFNHLEIPKKQANVIAEFMVSYADARYGDKEEVVEEELVDFNKEEPNTAIELKE